MRRASRTLFGACVWASIAFANQAANAEGGVDHPSPSHPTPKPGARPAPEAASAPPPEASADAAAETAYQQALAKYSRNDLQGALDSMAECYRLTRRAELLYNLASLERELKHCTDARGYYAKYLEQVPHGQHRAAAEQAQRELEQECGGDAVVAPPPPAATPKGTSAPGPRVVRSGPLVEPVPPHWTIPRVVGWSAIAAGALAGGGALYFTLAAKAERDDYQHSVDVQFAGGPRRDTSLEAAQHRDQNVARVLAVSGGALLTGGALVLLFGSRDRQSTATNAQIQVLPGRVQASYTQRF